MFLNPCDFLAVRFLIKLVHEKGKKPLQRLVPISADMVCTNTIPSSCYLHSLPNVSEISPQALIWGTGWPTGKGNIVGLAVLQFAGKAAWNCVISPATARIAE